MKIFTLEKSLWVPSPLEKVFAFFSDAANLERLTPPWLNFKILTPNPIVMKAGLLIDYALKLRGFPLRWQSEITVFEPPRRFIDEQTRGPYRRWMHEHRFTGKDRGTLIEDKVDFAVWGGSLVERFFVRPEVEKIFEYRRKTIDEIFKPRS